MMKQFDVVIEKDSEGYFVASVPALKGVSHTSQVTGCAYGAYS